MSSPLHIAIKHGHIDTVEVLLSYGHANPNIGVPIYDVESVDILRLLLAYGADMDPSPQHIPMLYKACSEGNLDKVKLLLLYGASIEPKTLAIEYCDSLHKATIEGHTGIVQALIDHGADINRSSNYYQQPIVMAVCQRDIDMISVLIANGAKVDLDIHGNTLLHIAAHAGYLDVVKILVEEGHMDIEAPDSKNKTALSIACMNIHLPVIEYLLSRGAKTTIQSLT